MRQQKLPECVFTGKGVTGKGSVTVWLSVCGTENAAEPLVPTGNSDVFMKFLLLVFKVQNLKMFPLEVIFRDAALHAGKTN